MRALAVPAALTATTSALTIAGGCASYSTTHRYEQARVIRVTDAQAYDLDIFTNFGDVDIAPTSVPLPAWAHKHAAPDLDLQARDGELLIVAVVGSNYPERVDAARVEPRFEGDRLTLSAAWPTPLPKNAGDGVRYALRGPGFRNATVFTDFGDIYLENATGHADLDSDYGDITLARHGGSADLFTDYGDIDVDVASGHHGPFVLETDYGDIVARGVNCDIDAKSDYGDVELYAVGGGVKAFSDFGKIDVSLLPSNPGPVELFTDFGDIDLLVGPDFQGDLETKADSGSTRLRNDSGANFESFGDDDFRVVRFGRSDARSHARTDFGDVHVTIGRPSSAG
ncbi:MAG: hypothetical protein CMJ31_09495, partial [Phycisphaerae bacterium]|nr:hypothetical protein [Phycisphaerae bacterium]